VDTIAKRLMSNQKMQIGGAGISFSQSVQNASQVVFKDAYSKPALQRYLSLFPGIGFAAVYKILQRVYKFGGQPILNDAVYSSVGDTVSNTMGEKRGRMFIQALSGSLIGAGEIVLLPFDVLKIKSQTNPEVFKGRGFFNLIQQEGIMQLYKGAGWTVMRNVPGSFALFGGNAWTKTHFFGLEYDQRASFFQYFVSSAVGGTLSIAVASPFDVVKTRLQNKEFGSRISGTKVVTDLLRQEGPGAFFKGLLPKILVVGPKLVFSFTIAQEMIAYFEEVLSDKPKSNDPKPEKKKN